ncbi:PPK2 family polyphosphate kinase [Anthocerotibacter panamensis]|uniref:PPK2 family polyphosphate kinase n=1 Tax=Anthocerotibacter panamensis TaxID=2857077 RepID=UPI001C407BD1|nr:PPK2 family polyphosphate kinase [Anthocerotibacter panamensis]
MAPPFQVFPGTQVDLNRLSADETNGLTQQEAQVQLSDFALQLETLQELLYVACQHSVLVVLQGLDTSGKDGTIKQVMTALNPQGVEVYSFKVPTQEEADHDFLWRVHRATPRRGGFTIFNRSHYEEVLVQRAHGHMSRETCQARFEHINHFEQLLCDEGTILFKFFLHISKGEQKKRLQKREEDPTKSWKLAVGDWQERAYWDHYVAAYEDIFSACSENPWYVIPANRKWYRNWAVAKVLVNGLERYRLDWSKALLERGEQARSHLETWRREQVPKM